MNLKSNIVAPTPARIRATLPRKTINKASGFHMSDSTITRIFKMKCYDEKEDDPWHDCIYLQCKIQCLICKLSHITCNIIKILGNTFRVQLRITFLMN